jgi:hypothetical protein
MTMLTTRAQKIAATPELSVPKALRSAWVSWLVLLAIPFLVLQWLVWRLGISDQATPAFDPKHWFFASMAYLAVILPASFFWRGYLFREYWNGRPVTPRKYVLATVTVGIALAIGGVFALIGCFFSGSFMPNLIPALMALLLFAIHWPTGRAMAKPVGHIEDPQIYEEPR